MLDDTCMVAASHIYTTTTAAPVHAVDHAEKTGCMVAASRQADRQASRQASRQAMPMRVYDIKDVVLEKEYRSA